jgi:hypothetical protein
MIDKKPIKLLVVDDHPVYHEIIHNLELPRIEILDFFTDKEIFNYVETIKNPANHIAVVDYTLKGSIYNGDEVILRLTTAGISCCMWSAHAHTFVHDMVPEVRQGRVRHIIKGMQLSENDIREEILRLAILRFAAFRE